MGLSRPFFEGSASGLERQLIPGNLIAIEEAKFRCLDAKLRLARVRSRQIGRHHRTRPCWIAVQSRQRDYRRIESDFFARFADGGRRWCLPEIDVSAGKGPLAESRFIAALQQENLLAA